MGLKVGVIGTGWIGQVHMDAYIADSRIDRVVVCDVDEAVVDSIRRKYPHIDAAYVGHQKMLSNESLDVVSVTSPDNFHREHSEACLGAGCHVLQTKPLATNLEDGQAIIRSAERAGVKLMVAHERRYRSNVLKIKELLESGELGDVVHVRSDSIQDKREQFRRSPWYASAAAGRTAIVGSGIHEVDMLRYLAGSEVRSVAAFSNALGGLSFPGNKTTQAVYSFGNEALGQTTITYEAHWPAGGSINDNFRLVATKGVIVGSRYVVDGMDEWATIPVDEDPVRVGSNGCIMSFLDAVVNRSEITITGRDAYATLAAAVAADQSAASGTVVVPSPTDFA